MTSAPGSATRPAVVFAGGDPAGEALVEQVPPGALMVAADSGLHNALALGLPVDVVVGDLDSVAPEALAAAEAAGAAIERHPVDKDATDLELALDTALRRGATEVLVVGIGGGRLDHFLANALLLASPAFASMRVEAMVGSGRVLAIHDRGVLHGRRGDLVTLLALGGPAREVTTTGLRFGLNADDLYPGSSRGVSNELVAPVATVELRAGTLLAVQPFYRNDL